MALPPLSPLHEWSSPDVVIVVAGQPAVTTSPFVANTPAGTWPSAALPVAFVLGAPASRDVGDAASAELDVALRTWARVPCTAWRARYDGVRAVAAADDGTNVVLFHDDAWPPELVPGAVAQTVVHTDPSGNYRDADIHLNGKDFRFSLDGAPGTLDLRSILVHELGHALGLGHSDAPRATMFATGSGLRWRSLEKDDKDGVCTLYPGQGAPGCEATPCPAPLLCVAGACQRPGEPRDVCSPCARVPDACEAAGDDARCVDIGEAGGAGRVCGRACASDAECGAGFSCVPTTTSGDRQCVSNDGCRNGASPCTTDAQCKDSTCRAGACLGAPEAPDAGPADGGADAGFDAGSQPGGAGEGGGCDCRATVGTGPRAPGAGGGAFVVAAAIAAIAAAKLRARGGR